MPYTLKPAVYEVAWEFDGTQNSVNELNAFYGYAPLPGLVPSADRTHVTFELRGDSFSLVTYQTQDTPSGAREWVELGSTPYGESSIILTIVSQSNYTPGEIIDSEDLGSTFDEVEE